MAEKLLKELQEKIETKEAVSFSDLKEIETFIRDFAAKREVAAAKVIHPLRLALTGSSASPGIFELIYILGKAKVRLRIKKALQFIKTARESVQN